MARMSPNKRGLHSGNLKRTPDKISAVSAIVESDRHATIVSMYIMDVLSSFLKNFKAKRPEMGANEWFLHWDNAPVHKASMVMEFLASKEVKVLGHPPYSPDLAPADFWLFVKCKTMLGGTAITGHTIRHAWERLVRTLPTEEFRATFVRWLERQEKCIRVKGSYIEKC